MARAKTTTRAKTEANRESGDDQVKATGGQQKREEDAQFMHRVVAAVKEAKRRRVL